MSIRLDEARIRLLYPAQIGGNVQINGGTISYKTTNYISNPILVYDDGTSYGHTLLVGAGGTTYIGAGESASTLYSNLGIKSSEYLILGANNNIQFYPRADSATSTSGVTLDSNKYFYPQINNTGSIGTSSYKWASMYATTFYGNLSGNATSASSLLGIASNEAVPLTDPGQGIIKYYYNVNYSLIGNMPSTNNANGILYLNTHNGEYGYQLGFSSDGNIYYRNKSASAFTSSIAWNKILSSNNYTGTLDERYVKKSGDTMIGNLTVPSLNTAFKFNNSDIPENTANLAYTAVAHTMTFYRNGITIPYQMDDSNDGGIIRVRGTSENNCIFELGTWDDSGDGETIQFNYYPTTSQVTPTYSVIVPKKSGTIALVGDSDAGFVKKSGDTMTGNLTTPSVYTSNWFRSIGVTGWYSETYGGGWYMADSTYIRNYNGKTVRLDNLCLGADNNSYRLYVNGSSNITGDLKLDGSITNLAVNGGIYWNPCVESASDSTDAASITVVKSGVAGGTELRISMENDSDDVINLNPAAWIYLKGKATFRVTDNWLRINESSGFSAGIYTGSSLIRSDNCLQVGDNGSAFLARNDGYGKFSTHLDIGSKLSLWQDSEGGNIQIVSGTDHTNAWQIDSYNGNLRFFTYRESDGAFQENHFDQNTGYINLANYAGYTMRWDVTASNPTTTSTDNCTSYFNQPGSHVYWYYSGGLINGQPSTYGYILDIGHYSERHQIWMTQTSGSLYHRGGNSGGWAPDGWKAILDSANYSSYTVPKSGGTFTGKVSINYAHNGGGMFQLMSTDSNEASIDYAAGGTSYWVVGKGCGGTGNGTFAWYYVPGGYNAMTLTSAGALAVATLNTNTINMNGNVCFQNCGYCYIGNGSSDSSPTVGGALTNLVISSWYGISFTTSCSSNYQNKTAIGFDCRNGIIRAAAVYGAVWNDYAEYRNQAEELKPGQVAYCGNDGKLKRTIKRLQKFEGVVSDTFGFAIGETDSCKTPLAVSGRVLVYTYEDRSTFNSGDCVCAAPNGRVSKMTREEIAYYPDRIVGVVSEIPDYEVWGTGNVNVNNRIWIRIR